MTPEAQPPPFSPARLGNPAFMDDGSEAPEAPVPTGDGELSPLQRKLREQASIIGHSPAEAPPPPPGSAVPASSMTGAALKRHQSEMVAPVPRLEGVPEQDFSAFVIAPPPGLGESTAGIPPSVPLGPPPGFAEAAAGLPKSAAPVPPAQSSASVGAGAHPPASAPLREMSRALEPLPFPEPSLPGFVPHVAAPAHRRQGRPEAGSEGSGALPPVGDDAGREVAPSDVMPMVADGGSHGTPPRGNRRKRGGALRLLAAVLVLQSILGVGFLTAMYYFPTFRGTVRKFSHRVLGTSAVVAQGEPRWIPLDPYPSAPPVASTDMLGFEKIGNLEENVENLQRLLSVIPKEAMSEISQLEERNELTRLADEAITRGSRSAYMQLASIAETSRDSSQVNGALAELLRVRFFFASGTRSAAYVLPLATLYPSAKSKKEEQLTQKELIGLLLDAEKDWQVRRRVAFLLGDKRSYEVAEALAEAVRSDPSLDVIKEAVYSFEAITGYRSPDLFEMKSLLEWWDANSAEVKKKLG